MLSITIVGVKANPEFAIMVKPYLEVARYFRLEAEDLLAKEKPAVKWWPSSAFQVGTNFQLTLLNVHPDLLDSVASPRVGYINSRLSG